jgi:hypothetical protein
MLKQQLSSVVLTRSSNCVSTAAKDKAELDVAFRQSIEGKFCIAAPTSILTIRTFDDLSAKTDEIMTLIAGLEQRLAGLEQALAQQRGTASAQPAPRIRCQHVDLSLTRR